MVKTKTVMSESSKMSMVEQFGFKNSELSQIENFMNDQNQNTAGDILENLMQDKKLNIRQKVMVAYIIGNSARESAIKEERQKGLIIDMSGGIPPIGG